MALKKYRFFVGACGPTMMYSNIIRAEDEISATKIYLSGSGSEPTDEEIQEQLRYIREVIPKDTPEKLLDCKDQEISVGDDVIVIKGGAGLSPKLVHGTVKKLSAKSIQVEDQAGTSFRIMLGADEESSMSKVFIMSPRPSRSVEGVMDATGYPIREGDPVVYLYTYFHEYSFKTGNVSKITEKSLVVDDTRKSFDRVVVINAL